MDLERLFSDFILEKSSYCSGRTIDFYRDNVGEFIRWFTSSAASADDGFSRQLMLSYLVFLRSKDVKNVSVRSYFRAVKVFISWLFDNGHLQENYAMRLSMPRDDSAVKVPLSASEVEGIDSLFDMGAMIGVRNYCIFHLMLDCGLRKFEVENFRKGNIDYERSLLQFIGKGSKVRIVPCPPFLLDRLQDYKTMSSAVSVNHEFLFSGRSGLPIGRYAVKDLFQKLKSSSGIKRLHPHLLRHTFATSYLCGGGNIEFLRILLGHSSIDVTQKYLHVMMVSGLTGQEIYKLDSVFFKFGFAYDGVSSS